MTRSKSSLLLFALTGCLHRPPDTAVLAPLVAYLTQDPPSIFQDCVTGGYCTDLVVMPQHTDQTNQLEYIVFADQLTATVFESLKGNAHYKITPIGTRLICPSNPPPSPHCYSLGVRVIRLMGDSAIATIERTYQRLNTGPAEVVIGGGYCHLRQLSSLTARRENGEWKSTSTALLGY